MSKTLLAMTQSILSDMSGDDVNSIFDTEEAEQVARIIVSTYEAMMSNTNWRHTRRLTSLTSFSDNTKPTHFDVPETIKEIVSINYDKIKNGETRKQFREVLYQEPDDFLRRLNTRDNTSSFIQTVTDPSGVTLLISNNKAPEWYTSFNDVDIVMDSFDSDVESTLQSSKLQVLAYVMPSFTLSDDSVPDLPVDAYAQLVEESTARCQWKNREFQDITAINEAGRQRRWNSRKSWKVGGSTKYPNYGRRR